MKWWFGHRAGVELRVYELGYGQRASMNRFYACEELSQSHWYSTDEALLAKKCWYI